MAPAEPRFTSGSDRESFAIEIGSDGVVRMSGRFDAAQVVKAEAVLSKMNGTIVADLTNLRYISSAGIGSLVKTLKRLQATGHAMKLMNLAPNIRNVFRYAGLDQIFIIE